MRRGLLLLLLIAIFTVAMASSSSSLSFAPASASGVTDSPTTVTATVEAEWDVIIVGAGLSGAVAARELLTRGPSSLRVLVLEARNRVGGRLFTAQKEGDVADLGGAWFWPGQLGIEKLAKEDLKVGLLKQNGRYFDGRRRVNGGAQSLAQRCLESEDVDSNGERRLTVELNAEVVAVENNVVRLKDARSFRARSAIVFAVPPRLLGQTVDFEPALPSNKMQWMVTKATTWMAATTKLAFVSMAEAKAHRGTPLSEVYDSGDSGLVVAFSFGNANAPASVRMGAAFAMVDWSQEKFTSGTEGAAAMGHGHPPPAPSFYSEAVTVAAPPSAADCIDVSAAATTLTWHFASSEADDSYGAGLMEGAVQSGLKVASQILAKAE